MRVHVESSPVRAGGFSRSVGTLIGGTAFGQALTVLALPLLTRLYSPQDFTALAVYIAAASIFATVGCLRLEIAIPLPEKDEDAVILLLLSLAFSAVTSLLLALILCAMPRTMIDAIGLKALGPYWLFLPLGVWVLSSYTAATYWFVRTRSFGLVARNRVAQSLLGVSLQLALGLFKIAPLGLLVGYVVGGGGGAFRMLLKFLRHHRSSIRGIRRAEIKNVLSRYRDFPKYSTFEAFANSAGIQIPVILIATYALGQEAGYLLLATRVMSVPMSLIGSAVSQAFLSSAAQEHRQGTMGDFSSRIVAGLMKTGLGPLAFVGIVAPFVFPMVFGREWERAGVLVAWMTPWFVMQFLASPLSMALHVTGNQKAALILQAFGMLFRIATLGLAFSVFPERSSEVYAISGFGFYGIYFGVLFVISGMSLKIIFERWRGFLWILIGWIAFASIIAALVSISRF